MVGECAERLLQSLERVLAAGQCGRREDPGEDLDGIPQLLGFDPRLMNLVGVAKPAVGGREDVIDERTLAPPGLVTERRTAAALRDPLEEFVDPALPIVFRKSFIQLANRPP